MCLAESTIKETEQIAVDYIPHIDRSNLLTTLNVLFAKNDIVLLEGEEGIGRTTLAKDFVKSVETNVISAFIRPATRWGYDPSSLQERFAEEMIVLLGRSMPEADQAITTPEYFSLLGDLERRCRRTRKPIYFVIDGLDELAEKEESLRSSLLEAIPFGMEGFKFLISWNIAIPFPHNTKFKVKSLTLPALSKSEADVVLSGINVSEDQISHFNTLSRGIPGRLASVRRLLLDKIQINENISDPQSFVTAISELEWKQIADADPLSRMMIALVAYSPQGSTIAQLADSFNQTLKEVVNKLNRFRFLSISSGIVSFIVEPFRVYVQNSLQSETKAILNTRIDKLLMTPSDPKSFEELPTLLDDTQRYSDLLELLSPDFYQRGLEKKKSLVSLKRSNAIGMAAAQFEKKDAQLLQFCLINCIFNELSMAELWRAEVSARMSVGDFDNAFIVANSSPINEDRLCLLALLAKLQRNKSGSANEDLLKLIRQAYLTSELDYTEQKIVQLATDLLTVLPDIAVEISNKLQVSRQGIDADVAIASILMQSDFMENPESTGKFSEIEQVRSQIVSPQVRLLTEVAPRLLGKESDATEVIRDSERIQSLKLKLPLLEAWVSRNRKTDQAAIVSEYAIQMMLADTKFLPTCRNFRRLLICLPYCATNSSRERIINLVAGVLGTLETRGPTLDYVRLKLLLIETAISYGTEAEVDDSLVKVIDYVNSVQQIGPRTECRAAIWAFLHQMDLSRQLLLKQDVLNALSDDYDDLLKQSANHFVASRSIVQSLARGSLDVACNYSLKLNIEKRRDQSLTTALEAASKTVVSTVDLQIYTSNLDKIADPRHKYSGVATVLRNLAKIVDQQNCNVINVNKILPLIHSIDNASVRVTALANLRLLMEHDTSGDSSDQKEYIEQYLTKSWQSIDRLWDRIRSGYDIVAVVGTKLSAMAIKVLESTNGLKSESVILAPETALAAISAIRLASAALSGLMQRHLLRDEDINRLKLLIDTIPSYGEQALLWADVAQRFIICGDQASADKIVTKYVHPIMNQIPSDDSGFKNYIMVMAAQVFWSINSVTSAEYFKTMARQLKEEAYVNICYFLIRKEPLFEPVAKLSMVHMKPDYNTLVKVIDLMQFIEDDDNISALLEMIVDAIDANKSRFTQEQTSDITRRLESLISTKLPCLHGIKHEGYNVYCNANIGRIKKSCDWQVLQQQAQDIPNVADRCFVMGKVASHLPNRLSPHRDQLLLSALADTKTLPSCFDQVQGLVTIAGIYEKIDKKQCKPILGEAMRISSCDDSELGSTLQKRVVDSAHSVDPDMAQELLNTLDNDPARLEARLEMKQELDILSATRNVRKKDSKSNHAKDGFRSVASQTTSSPNPDMVPSVAWRALAQLNGGAGLAYSLSELKEYYVKSADLPLSAAFPVMNWTFSCVSKLYGDTDQANTILRTLCELSLSSASLCLGLISRCMSALALHSSGNGFQKSPLESGIIQAGDSESAFIIINKWIVEQSEEYITICDPYFNLEDLQILRYVLESRKELTITVVTDLSRFSSMNVADTFNTTWNHIMSVPPPLTEIMLMTTEPSKTFPIHDRWIISKKSGLRIGTSFSGLGNRRASEISEVDESKACEYFAILSPYITRTTRIHLGERLKYLSFTLE